MMIKNRLRVGVAGLATFAFMASGSAAFAHYIYKGGHVHKEAEMCVYNYTELSHGPNGNGYATVRVDLSKNTSTMAGTFSCAAAQTVAPKNIKGRVTLYKVIIGTLYECWTSGTVYNDVFHHKLDYRTTPFTKAPCGTANYALKGSAYGRLGSTETYKGGAIGVGNHTLPMGETNGSLISVNELIAPELAKLGGSPVAVSSSAPNEFPWTDANGVIDFTAAPRWVGVVKPGGEIARCWDGSELRVPFEPTDDAADAALTPFDGGVPTEELVDDGSGIPVVGMFTYDTEQACERFGPQRPRVSYS